MEGVILSKVKFLYLNEQDALGLFQEQINKTYNVLDDDGKLFFLWEEYIHQLNKNLTEQFDHFLVTPLNELKAWDGLSYHILEHCAEDIFEISSDLD